MKLVCSVAIRNRILPSNSKQRYLSSTLALCKSINGTQFSLILFSTQNKTGNKYEVKNISNVLTRFMCEGKATIQFHMPQHDLYIQAEVILLKGFLNILKLAIQNKSIDKEIRIPSSMSVTTSKPIVKKLNINKRSDFPDKGFPRTLEVLLVNNVDLTGLSRGILQLPKLRVLDLSNNCLETLPDELGNSLCLSELNLSNNHLGKPGLLQWNWLGGKLLKSLKILNLRNNQLKYLPNRLKKLQNIRQLNVDFNDLKFLPPGIGFLNSLRTLTMSNNQIGILPNSIRRLRLDDLDISDNHCESKIVLNQSGTDAKGLSVLSLKEHAFRKILKLQLLFTSEMLPYTLYEELENAEYCKCGSPCLDSCVKALQLLSLNTIASNLSLSPTSSPSIPCETYFCSLFCCLSAPMCRRRLMIR